MNKSIETYFQILKCLSKDYNFAAMTAEQHRQSYIRDAFITGYIKKKPAKAFIKHDINIG